MPTVLRIGPYRFFFYADDREEPPHIHVERGEHTARFWLDEVRLWDSRGFGRTEIRRIQKLVEDNQEQLLRSWHEKREAAAKTVSVTEDTLTVHLADGRTLSVPLAWYPCLLHGSSKERSRWRLIGKGEGIHWPDLDEDISVESLLFGHPSGESQKSFKRWLADRKTHARSSSRTPNEIRIGAARLRRRGRRAG